MKPFWERLGFRRSDEMELAIALKALRWSSLFSACALFALSVYETITTGKAGWAFFILIVQTLVFWVAHAVLARRLGGGGYEE